MAAASKDHEEFSTPHLPERYRKVVKAKKQRRRKRLVLAAGIAVLVIVGIYLVVNGTAGGIFSQTQSGSPSPQHATTIVPTASAFSESSAVPANNATITPASFEQGAGLLAPLPAGVITLDAAMEALRLDYPAAEYSVLSANLTSRSGRYLYEFGMHPDNSADRTVTTVFIDAVSKKPYSPGEEEATVSREGAGRRALAVFPALQPDRTVLVFTSSPEEGNRWEFALYNGSGKLAAGILNADDGSVLSFEKIIQPGGRPAAPAIDAEHARAIADRYIIDHNGGQLPLNMSSSRYEPVQSAAGPVAGQYTFTYERTFQDFPTDTDGFTVVVDAMTGMVTGYSQQWTTPDYAFATVPQQNVIRREATFAVLQKGKDLYPDLVGGLRIISAEIRWKNRVPYGTVPRPGTVPLGWKVVFDDDLIRANASAVPAVAWIDVQSGDFIVFDYEH